ncbi:MAG: type IV pilus assembly protein PilM [bacterium]
MIGIDISDRSVKVVQLSPGEPHHLLAHCWQEVPSEVIERGIVSQPPVLQKVIVEVMERCHLSAVEDTIVASIPETQSFLRVIELPMMNEEEMDEAVPWEVARHIPFGLENVYIDWQPVSGGHKTASGGQEVLVGAAQKKVIDPLLKIFQNLKLDVAALELEGQAIARALVSPELKSHQGLLVVDLGGTATNVIIHDHGAVRFTASLQRGARNMAGTLSAEEAKILSVPSQDELSKDEAERMAAKLRAAQEELVIEIRGIVEFYNGIDVQHEVKEILLTGGGSNFPGLDAVFLRFFDNVHVQRGNPWVNVLPPGAAKKPPLSLRESVHFSTALGLALRETDE